MNVSLGTVKSDVGASEPVSSRRLLALRCLCFAGLAISIYLAWTALSMTPVYGCTGGDVVDCDHVLKSKWSKVLGVPVSVPAAGLYASMLVLLGFLRMNSPLALQRMVWNVLTAGACMAGLAAIWFIGLQAFELQKVCPYCLAAHACGLTVAWLVLRNRVSTAFQKRIAASFATAAMAVLITIQVNTPAPEVFEIVRYTEDISAESSSSSVVADDSAMEVFGAPGEVFEAPGDVESPEEALGVAESESAKESDSASTGSKSSEAVNAESIQPLSSTLLLIMRPGFMRLFHDIAVQDQVPSTGGERLPEASSDKRSSSARRLITVAGNRITLDVKQWPLLGRPDAPYVFVEMFDYTCPHCRNTHHAIRGAFETFGDDLAIVALPVPLDRACNDASSGNGTHIGGCELARIAIAVWRVNPEKFQEFHDWMFETSRTVSAARAHAEKLVGAEEFRKEFASRIPADYVKRHVDLYKKVGKGAVPKMLFPRSTINGEINSRSTMVSTIERELRDTVTK